jgi:ubiquinone/menaquinone biosynthesis C-methylase UbiE
VEFWNQRYSQKEYAYGIKPNAYLKDKLQTLPTGKILFAADGEGRNAVYAAKNDWNIVAFDISVSGKEKSDALALENNVKIEYIVSDLENLTLEEESFDALVLIFAHFPEEKRQKYHKKLSRYVKKNGHLIVEGFSKNHQDNQTENSIAGGPKYAGMLYDLKELRQEFRFFDLTEAYETETQLNEGLYHVRKASVVRIFGRKH